MSINRMPMLRSVRPRLTRRHVLGLVVAGAASRSGSQLGTKVGGPNEPRCCQGSDDELGGDRLREIDVVELPLIPFLYPERLLHDSRRSGVGRYATAAKGLCIARDEWSRIAARAKREGLRGVAHDPGVSHETVRPIAQWVKPAALTDSPSVAPRGNLLAVDEAGGQRTAGTAVSAQRGRTAHWLAPGPGQSPAQW